MSNHTKAGRRGVLLWGASSTSGFAPRGRGMKRRDFLKGMVIAGTTVSLGAEPQRFTHLLPFLDPPENVIAGVSTWFATSCRECPAGCGLVVRNRDGRAVKVEGNPLHPINAGRTCPRGQAFLQGLYDPDRVRRPLARADGRLRARGWSDVWETLGPLLASSRGGGQVAVISDLQTGSLEALIRQWLGAFDSDRYLIYEPLNYEPVREANRAVYGRAVLPDYRFDQSDLIVSFAADFLETWISPVRFIRRFASRRAPTDGEMSKFVYVGPRLSQTALNADEYYLVRPGDERDFALAVLGAMGRGVAGVPSPDAIGRRLGVDASRFRSLARQLIQARRPLVVGGAPILGHPLTVEAATAAALLQRTADASAVDLGRPHALSTSASHAQVASFVEALGSGQVKALVIIGANPAHSLPPSVRFAEALREVPVVIGLATHPDETAELATWVLPTHHPLESWGDYEPEVGVRNLLQPVMGPLYGTQQVGDLLLHLAAAAGLDVRATLRAGNYLEYLRSRWDGPSPAPGLPEQTVVPTTPWQEALQRGGAWSEEDTAVSPAAPVATAGGDAPAFSPPGPRPKHSLWLYPHPLLYDGRSANKRWLQEVPDPVTHVVWGSWAETAPETARGLGVAEGEGMRVTAGDQSVTSPLYVYRGVAPDTVAVPLGQGHTAFGRYAAGKGVNAYRLLDPRSPTPAVTVAAGPGAEDLVTPDGSVHQHGRHLAQAVTLSALAHGHPDELVWPLPEGYAPDRDLYPPHEHVGHRWAMAVDLSRCVGCGACMVACQAENNVAVVGKAWVSQGREMHWLRISRYFDWDSPYSPALFLPMLCQHCDAAPCEPVCPVFAAAHTEEGLNQQIYNRCIGTRYCNNNCPYKVRRFNWRNYDWPEPLTWQLNPDVTVRCRGVMEKCTFCVQRIREVEHRARREDRPVRDGEILPACAQACPAGVYTFGDLLDPDSAVSRLVRGNPRRYQVLQELNTKPAVIYLRKVFRDLGPRSA